MMPPAPENYGGTIAPGEGMVPAAPPRPAPRPIASVPLQPTGTHILQAAEEKPTDAIAATPETPQAETPAADPAFPFSLAGAPENQPALTGEESAPETDAPEGDKTPATNQSDEDAQGGGAPPATTLSDDVPRG